MTSPASPPPAEPGLPRRPRPAGTIRVGSFAGSDLYVTSTWFVVAALISVVVAPRIDAVQPGLGPWKYLAGLLFAIVLYLAVLLHEGSHALVARRFGFVVESITLHFLGGMTEIEGSAKSPRQEFWIAVVGPVTSLVIGGAALAAWTVVPAGLLAEIIGGLAMVNLLIGVLNLVPGLPLDGGRVLKAGVWRLTGSQHRGTIVAGWGGRLTAVALLAWPWLQERWLGLEATVLDHVLVVIVALFLWTGATASMANARLRSRIPHLVARPLARRALAVPGDLPLAEAVRRAQESGAGSIVTVSAADQPTGIVSESVVRSMPEERRPWVSASSAARGLEDGLTLPADLAGEDLILAISRRPAEDYLLVESDGQIAGVLATADVDRAFREGQH